MAKGGEKGGHGVVRREVRPVEGSLLLLLLSPMLSVPVSSRPGFLVGGCLISPKSIVTWFQPHRFASFAVCYVSSIRRRAVKFRQFVDERESNAGLSAARTARRRGLKPQRHARAAETTS